MVVKIVPNDKGIIGASRRLNEFHLDLTALKVPVNRGITRLLSYSSMSLRSPSYSRGELYLSEVFHDCRKLRTRSMEFFEN